MLSQFPVGTKLPTLDSGQFPVINYVIERIWQWASNLHESSFDLWREYECTSCSWMARTSLCSLWSHPGTRWSQLCGAGGLRWPLTRNPFQIRDLTSQNQLCSIRPRPLIFSHILWQFCALLTWRSSPQCPPSKIQRQLLPGPHFIYAEQVAKRRWKGERGKEMQKQFQVCLSFGAHLSSLLRLCLRLPPPSALLLSLEATGLAATGPNI